MISAASYIPVYYIVVAIISLAVYFRYAGVAPSYSNVEEGVFPSSSLTVGVMAIAVAIFIGCRPNSYIFVDMVNTIGNYRAFYEGVPFQWNSDTDNLIYDNFLAWTGSQRLGTEFFFTVIAVIYFGCTYLGVRRLFPNHTALAYLAFLGAFSTFSYATNGVKAGSAAAVFIWAISYYKQWMFCLPLLLLSYGLHHSMLMPVVAFLFSAYWKNTKHFFVGWLFCFVCAAAHITFFQELFAGMTDDTGADYLNAVDSDWGGKSGFRLDFVLYSVMPILIGYYAIYKRNIQSALYEVLLKTYLLTNGVWMLCMYAAFTNRIAYLSWNIYPIVLLFPLLNEEWGEGQYMLAAKVFMLHLAFTLFMTFVY